MNWVIIDAKQMTSHYLNVLNNCQFDLWEQNSIKFEKKYQKFSVKVKNVKMSLIEAFMY